MNEELKDLIKDYLEAHGYDVSKADELIEEYESMQTFTELNDGSFEYFNIDKDDKEIYKSLYGKKAKIYASEATLLHKKDVKQIEDENGEILKKYDYDFAIKSTDFFSGTFAFCFNVIFFKS